MDLITLLFGNSTIKITEDATGVTKWPMLNVISADITSATSVGQNPVSGTPVQFVGVYENAVTNNMKSVKVIMPTSMTLNAIIPDISTAESIIQAWKSQTDTYSITARSVISNNMALVSVEYRQSPDQLSAIAATLTFEQTVESILSNFDPKQTADRDSVGITTKAPESLTTKVSSFYNSVTSKLGL